MKTPRSMRAHGALRRANCSKGQPLEANAEQPYKVTFHNVMTDEKDQPVELKHHAAGYLWIEPNHHVTHSAAQGHEFALRDRESKERLAVSVHALGRDEL